ncbi:hypothetical protein [Streptomyces chattanoogensis]|uniref:hypothetical protein n=1 Tax=Streptomyces chattanoogensis TaxID=66876 RepID=UPI0006B5B345|nr:hypothetical protein [Streptomyces chattanoogensis]
MTANDEELSFTRVGQTLLYALPSGPNELGWRGLLLPEEPAPEETIPVRRSLRSHAHYLFASQVPYEEHHQDSIDAFISAVREFAADKWYCLWIRPQLAEHGIDVAYFLRLRPDPYPQTTDDWSQNLGSGYLFGVPSGTALSIGDDHPAVLALSPDPGIRFGGKGNDDDSCPLATKGGIPFSGPLAGCFLLSSGTMPLLGSFRDLPKGIRYAHPGTDGETVAQTYPVLAPTADERVPWCGAFDPLDPYNTSPLTDVATGRLRSFLTPSSNPALRVPSHFRTATGRAIDLLPIGGEVDELRSYAGSLVLQRTEESANVSSLYVTYAGDWAPAVADETSPGTSHELLCGLYGLDRMTFRSWPSGSDQDCDRFRFVPGRAAYAARFPYQQASAIEPGELAARLSDRCRTSYVTVVPAEGGSAEHRTQPESAPLYGSGAKVGGGEVLPLREIGTLLPGSPGFGVPLVPYAGLGTVPDGFPADELAPFESQILSPLRKAAVRAVAVRSGSPAPVADAVEDTIRATSPQGFLVELSGSTYRAVTLARTGSAGPHPADLALSAPTQAMVNLLQANQVFAVAVNPAPFGTMATGREQAPEGGAMFRNSVTIGGWTMHADVGKGSALGDFRNVVIFKFCDGSVLDRVRHPAKWTDTADFSLLPGSVSAHRDTAAGDEQAVGTLSQWLQGYLAEAIDEAGRGNTLYADFARHVQDPNWRGVLVLGARIDPSGLPEQIRGLSAGIDFSQFRAHHFGITVTPVAATGGSIGITGDSSLFALIDYRTPEFRASVGAGADPDLPLVTPDGVQGYAFRVLQLQALFHNAALADFRSRAQLTAGELFGSQVTATSYGTRPVASNAVVLKGRYQSQGGRATYVMETDAPTVFTLDSNVLQAVAFDRVQFNTVSADQHEIRSRFLIWGSLDFAALTSGDGSAFDMLSFGSPPVGAPPSGQGLAFSHLQVDLTSPTATPNAVSFRFDPSGLAFDTASSRPREGGLFSQFALQPDGFVAAPAGKRPAGYGFLPVAIGPVVQELDGPWYGIVTKVTMGTAGALAAKAGFSSSMLLAWSPQSRAGDPRHSAFVGLRLPGTAPGAKTLSLEGVLKVSISGLALQYEKTSKLFTLRLSNAGLSFLGIAKLPPGASINFFLFGDPAGKGSLGWYAAYRKKKPQSVAVGSAP